MDGAAEKKRTPVIKKENAIDPYVLIKKEIAIGPYVAVSTPEKKITNPFRR